MYALYNASVAVWPSISLCSPRYANKKGNFGRVPSVQMHRSPRVAKQSIGVVVRRKEVSDAHSFFYMCGGWVVKHRLCIRIGHKCKIW